jgi:apolipoprotein N-acyltransferase
MSAGFFAFLTVSAGATFPRTPAQQKNVWHRVVRAVEPETADVRFWG